MQCHAGLAYTERGGGYVVRVLEERARIPGPYCRITRSTLYDLPKALEVDLIEQHRKRYPDESAQSTATRNVAPF
jgi:hypothetical protein